MITSEQFDQKSI